MIFSSVLALKYCVIVLASSWMAMKAAAVINHRRDAAQTTSYYAVKVFSIPFVLSLAVTPALLLLNLLRIAGWL